MLPNVSDGKSQGISFKGDPSQIAEFLDLLFRNVVPKENDSPVYLSLRAFNERGKAGEKPARITAVQFTPDLSELVQAITQSASTCANPKKPMVFAPPVCLFDNVTRAREKNLKYGVCLSVELDAGDITQKKQELEDLLGPITCVVASGGEVIDELSGITTPKMHLHWRLVTPTTEKEGHDLLKRARSILCDLVGGDVTGKPIVHPYRWPGSWHLKDTNKPRLCKIIERNPEAEIDLEVILPELENALKGIPLAKRLNGSAKGGNGEVRNDAELIRRLRTGEEYHSTLRDLAWRYIQKGFEPNDAEEHLFGLMDSIPEHEREAGREKGSWEHRKSQIPNLVDTAYEKKLEADGGRNLPVIRVKGGSIASNVADAEDVLAAAALQDPMNGVFQRGNRLVRIVRYREATVASSIKRRNDIKIDDGTLTITEMHPSLVRLHLCNHARFKRYDKRTKEWNNIDPPKDIAGTLAEMSGWEKIPRLAGVISAPTLIGFDGKILSTPGYDEETGLFFDPGGVVFPDIPDKPTKDDAIKALGLLKKVIADFPFVSEESRSVALANFITPAVRFSIESSPLFAYSAPTSETGKTLLGTTSSLIWVGREPVIMSKAKDEEEIKKTLLPLLIKAPVISMFDNLEVPLKSAALCTILTSGEWEQRVLGSSENRKVPTATTFVATGNNLVIEGDLRTRTLMCELDAALEYPGERVFDVNLKEYIPSCRGELAMAALVIVRAYLTAGCPNQNIPVFGRFEKWSELVRSALVWLGCADPYETRLKVITEDPDTAQLRNLLEAWHNAFGVEWVTVAEAIQYRDSTPPDGREFDIGDAVRDHLRAALAGFAGNKAIGVFIGERKNRIVGGLRFEDGRLRHGLKTWRAMRVEG